MLFEFVLFKEVAGIIDRKKIDLSQYGMRSSLLGSYGQLSCENNVT